MRLLHIDSSVLGQGSVTRTITAAVAARITAANPTIQTSYRDLVAEPVPYMTLSTLPSSHPVAVPTNLLDKAQREARSKAECVLEEFLEADIVVLGVPMYNFGVAAQLKSWFDAIIIPGKTFTYGPQGPVGLANAKRIVVVISRGSRYGTSNFPLSTEHAETYVRSALSFIGVTTPEVVIAEGVANDRKAALNSAMRTVGLLPVRP